VINVSRLYCGIENSSDRFRYHSVSGPVVVYNCTNKCGQNCLHCYSKTDLDAKELDTQQAKNFLNQLVEIKCPVVLFSGGEPLERADLFELLDYSSKLGLRTALSTNGNLINEQVAKMLIDVGVSYVGVSIDGTEKTHDNFRGIAGSFKKAVNAVKFCKEVNLKIGLRFTMTNRNFSQIHDIFSLAQNLNVQRICFYHLISAGQAVKNNLKCTNQQVRQSLNDILNCAKGFSSKGVTEVLTVGNHADGAFVLNRLKQEKLPLYEKTFDLLQKFGGNKIGIKILDVDSAGNIHPDQFWQNYSLGNVTEMEIGEIFKKSLNIFMDKTEFSPDRCKKCCWLKICGTNMRDTHLEPDCYLDDKEIEGKQNEFAC